MKVAHLITISCLMGLFFDYHQPWTAKNRTKPSLITSQNAAILETKESNRSAEDDLIVFARKFLGVKYQYGQADPKRGFDCSGFVYFVFKEFGISLPRSSSGMGQAGADISLEEAKAGDIILFTGTNPANRRIGHVGIVLTNTDSQGLRFIHASSGKAQAVTETNLEGSYQRRFMKIVRVL